MQTNLIISQSKANNNTLYQWRVFSITDASFIYIVNGQFSHSDNLWDQYELHHMKTGLYIWNIKGEYQQICNSC